jgi:hypothetical protein
MIKDLHVLVVAACLYVRLHVHVLAGIAGKTLEDVKLVSEYVSVLLLTTAVVAKVQQQIRWISLARTVGSYMRRS